MHITDELLSQVFSDASMFCGREDVIHAIVHHRLVRSGISPLRISREQNLTSAGRVDVVLYGDSLVDRLTDPAGAKPIAAIEVKGGAYGNRNALQDELDSTGFCKDMTKLQVDASRGVECWFVCIDMPELGRAVSALKAQLVSERCTAHGLCFAYYCQGESFCYISRPERALARADVPVASAGLTTGSSEYLFTADDPRFRALARSMLMVSGNEANISSLLYNSLRDCGYGVQQLSLETYFSFAAKPGTRMQDRPDMVIFDASFDGRFNLYKGGNTRLSNDRHKLAHIETIVEVKGGSAIGRKSDAGVMRDYLRDIEKLGRWREKADIARPGTHPRTLFVSVDGRRAGLSQAAREELVSRCEQVDVDLIHIGHNAIEHRRGR